MSDMNVTTDAAVSATRSAAPKEKARKVRRRRGTVQEDALYVPPEIVPAGFTVEWKRQSIWGQPDKVSHMMNLRSQGWEYVNTTTNPEFKALMPENWAGNTIERDGCVLMIREEYLSREAREDDLNAARQQVSEKQKQLYSAGRDEMERITPKVRTSYDPFSPEEARGPRVPE